MRRSISALKPGPVVPPGTQKTPDQAARISQSVDFGHLSDILGFLWGGSIFDTFFTLFHFYIFIILSLFHFLLFHFFWFYRFLDFCHFLSFCHFSCFCVFSLFFHVFQFLQGYLKDKALFWPLFLTVVLSHGKHFEGVIS